MRILTPYDNFNNLKNAVFLAGTCFKDNDWRDEAIKLFEKHGFDGDIINPVNNNYDDNLVKQTKFEVNGFHYASCILFWIPRSEQNPGLTTNIEFGEWFNKDGVYVGFPDNSYKNDYLEVRLRESGLKRYSSLEEMVKKIVKHFKCQKRIFFTSDTHFSAQRTLELSYRPFRTVEEMDLVLISNWNKRITANDTVIHLGDFGNPDIISLLNFKELFFLEGNYERKNKSITEKLLRDKRVKKIEPRKIAVNGVEYFITHEPLFGNNMKVNDKSFFLFGHIHRLQMVKENGINVGCDANRYYPMSLQELKFLRGGIENHFDENVFGKRVQRKI
jgi:calcineurin-like phosphoesterase family protein